MNNELTQSPLVYDNCDISLKIVTINLNTTRKLKARWSCELDQDFRAYNIIDEVNAINEYADRT